MKQFKSFPRSFRNWWATPNIIVIIFVFSSHLSFAETFWDDFADGSMEVTGFNKFEVRWPADSMQWYRDQDIIHGQHRKASHRETLFPYIPSYEIPHTLPDDLLTPRMNFWVSTWDPISPYYSEIGTHPDWAPARDIDMEPPSNPVENTVCYSDADDIRAMRIPAPASLALVVIGLLSLRLTRRLRY